MRWRLRGAMQWPAFALFTLLDALVLDALPPVSTIGLNLIEGLLIATFANLFLIGVAAPFIANRLERRREVAVAGAGATPTAAPPEAEYDVRRDRVATVLLAAGLGATLVSGLANRPVIVSETEATEEVGRELRAYVARSGSAELRRNLETASTIRLSEGFFRACISRDDRRRNVCLLIDTDKEPTEVRRDPSAEPNAGYAAPDATRGR